MIWTEKLVDLVLSGVGAAVGLIPDHLRKQALARIGDHNPLTR
jgi:hypothetical protein